MTAAIGVQSRVRPLQRRGLASRARRYTGVYWKPVYAVLEGHFELIVGNAHHIKAVPGRNTVSGWSVLPDRLGPPVEIGVRLDGLRIEPSAALGDDGLELGERDEVPIDHRLRIPRDRGRGFHGIVGVNSTGRWAGIPRDPGHLGSGA